MSNAQVSRREFIGGAAAGALAARAASAQDAGKTRSYNPDMDYRRLGRTGMMISAVSIGGHWKRIPHPSNSPDFKKNRREVIYACLERGINYVDACSSGEVAVYAEALGERREEIFFGFDWTLARDPAIAGSLDKMKEGLDGGMKKAGLKYVDLWRPTLHEQATKNSDREIETVIAALDWAKKTGRARATGVATHHRPWVAAALGKFPQIEVIVTPYSAGSKEKPIGSMFEAVRKFDAGMIGIKPFASGSLFASRGAPDSQTRREDDERARMALRYVLCCDVLTAAIPGLVTVDQVRNAAAAIKERRRLDTAETARHREVAAAMWQRLPSGYEWLRDWEWV